MAAGDVLLDVSDVGLTLGGRLILDGVSFQVLDRVRPDVITGQVVALLGPSGVGKTRLLRIIAGLDAPDRGSVKGMGGAPFPAGAVGVVFQNYPLLRHRTVFGNLVVAGLANQVPRDQAEAHARRLLEAFGLEAHGELYPAQLSGGQRQRAAIAQQLMRPRQLIILDEPFSGLDPAALRGVAKLLIDVAHMDEANTLILITHDIRAALMTSDQVVMLGRKPDEQGRPTGGAAVRREYDLVARGLAWREDADEDPALLALEAEIKGLFRSL